MKNKSQKLYDKLIKFKDKPKFHTWGFSAKGYQNWMKEALSTDAYLVAVGIEFFKTKGVENEYTDYVKDIIYGE